MLLLLLTLLQPQQPRISRVVIAGAIIVFVGGVSLLVYFYRRYKRSEKDPEEDWDMARRSLFVNVPPPAAKTEEAVSEVSAPVPDMPPALTGATREFATGIELAGSVPSASEPEIEPVMHQEAARDLPVERAATQEPTPPAREVVPQVIPQVEPPPVSRPTEVLASLSPQQPATPTPTLPATEPTVFDEGVWADLELAEQSPLGQEERGVTATLKSAEPPTVARVEQRSSREPFETPRIELMEQREPYETPRIERLTPREQVAGTQQLRSVPPPRPERASEDRDQTRQSLGTGLFGSLPPSSSATPVTPPRMASETRELVAADWSAARVPAVAEGHGRKLATGSVLGLPAEPSYGPLILGNVVRNSSDVGIDALSNYGKDVGPKGGRGGTIALLLVVGLLGGGVLLYLFVPSVHSKVGSLIGQVRGTNALAAQEAAMKPKVQIIPQYPQVNKNLVTAKGAVDNISEEQLENLSVEVSLLRGGDTPAEVRTVSVVPNPLPPSQRGTFEFEYDGSRDTGFRGYKITRVLSNDTEIRFRAPGK